MRRRRCLEWGGKAIRDREQVDVWGNALVDLSFLAEPTVHKPPEELFCIRERDNAFRVVYAVRIGDDLWVTIRPHSNSERMPHPM